MRAALPPQIDLSWIDVLPAESLFSARLIRAQDARLHAETAMPFGLNHGVEYLVITVVVVSRKCLAQCSAKRNPAAKSEMSN